MNWLQITQNRGLSGRCFKIGSFWNYRQAAMEFPYFALNEEKTRTCGEFIRPIWNFSDRSDPFCIMNGSTTRSHGRFFLSIPWERIFEFGTVSLKSCKNTEIFYYLIK